MIPKRVTRETNRESDAWHEHVKRKLQFWVEQQSGFGRNVTNWFDWRDLPHPRPVLPESLDKEL
jgi:hypothetical protein